MESTATIPTASARRYLGQFVSHFGHKLPVSRTDDNAQGLVTFPLGPCTLTADATGLTISIEAQSAEDAAKLQEIVDRHLQRFAFREELSITWR
jgi:hypothetical protein